ncbi:MAG: SCP2 sterol-binding domain-containing protein [Anaerolineales bacterium]|jgi:putative sterol carrier protein
MSDELTIEELMGRMPKAFQPEKAEGVEAVVQYHLTGDQGGDWVVRIGGGACQVEEGNAEAPNLTLTAEASDYLAIITGKLNAMGAFAEGKLKLKGDLPLAMKLMNFFKLPA